MTEAKTQSEKSKHNGVEQTSSESFETVFDRVKDYIRANQDNLSTDSIQLYDTLKDFMSSLKKLENQHLDSVCGLNEHDYKNRIGRHLSGEDRISLEARCCYFLSRLKMASVMLTEVLIIKDHASITSQPTKRLVETIELFQLFCDFMGQSSVCESVYKTWLQNHDSTTTMMKNVITGMEQRMTSSNKTEAVTKAALLGVASFAFPFAFLVAGIASGTMGSSSEHERTVCSMTSAGKEKIEQHKELTSELLSKLQGLDKQVQKLIVQLNKVSILMDNMIKAVDTDGLMPPEAQSSSVLTDAQSSSTDSIMFGVGILSIVKTVSDISNILYDSTSGTVSQIKEHIINPLTKQKTLICDLELKFLLGEEDLLNE